MKSIKFAEKEQSQPSSKGPAAQHKTPQARNSFPQTSDLLDTPVPKISQWAIDKQAQTSKSHIFSNLISFSQQSSQIIPTVSTAKNQFY